MKRKVVQIAGFTKVVSLPSKWAKIHNIKKGDELDIKEGDSMLIVTTDKHACRLRRAQINASKIDQNVIWPIMAVLHKTGYEEIKITAINKDLMKVIHGKVASSLFGFEVIEQREDFCIVKNIARGAPDNFQNLLRKIFLVTLSQAHKSLEILEKKELDATNEIFSLEETNNKLTNFCQRMLNEEAMTIKNRYNYFVVWLLESLADSYRDLFKALPDKKEVNIEHDVLSAHAEINRLFNKYYEMFYKFNLEDLSTFLKDLKASHKNILGLMSKKKGANVIVLSHLFLINSQLYDFVGATISLKGNLEVNLDHLEE